MAGHQALLMPVAGQGTVGTQLEHHLRCALGVAPADDVLRLREAGERRHVFHAGQKQIAQADCVAHAGLSAVEWPERQTQIGVECHLRASGAGMLHARKGRVAGRCRNGQ